MNRRLLALSVLLLATACAHQPELPENPENPPQTQPSLALFIEDGKTTRQQVLLKLGTPSAEFENQRILTYRLNCQLPSSIHPVPRVSVIGEEFNSWNWATHDLVLVFDDRNVVVTHALIEVKQ